MISTHDCLQETLWAVCGPRVIYPSAAVCSSLGDVQSPLHFFFFLCHFIASWCGVFFPSLSNSTECVKPSLLQCYAFFHFSTSTRSVYSMCTRPTVCSFFFILYLKFSLLCYSDHYYYHLYFCLSC